MKGKTVKESAITSSHLMLIKDSGNFIFDGGKTIPNFNVGYGSARKMKQLGISR